MPPLLQTCDASDLRIRCRYRAQAEDAGTLWLGDGVWYWLRETRISQWTTCPFCDGALPLQPVAAQGDGYSGEDGG
jgi:hypothetical protein